MPMDPRFRACFKTITLREFGVALRGRPLWSLPCDFGIFVGERTERGEEGETYLVEPMRRPDGSLGLRYCLWFRSQSPPSRPRRKSPRLKSHRLESPLLKVDGKEIKHEKCPVRERPSQWLSHPGTRRHDVA